MPSSKPVASRSSGRRRTTRTAELPADADLERNERLQVVLRDDQLVGVGEVGEAAGDRGDGFDAAGERHEPLRLEHGLRARDRTTIDLIGLAELEAGMILADL